ncbi:MAG: hypothetical protein COV91_05500 [Candidatus Taylorbacteria bacterium CG11_big_fil_rev_8_21_14_0_20_46_11]|uniref:Apea-like HEPN domain-containing protein n=1 Tax=Candidatus Taylorbacteria bacterium CG11_big_fil_rev_8_21_14_0_20_46_11 TaxID=1975025 RepID=A0A2H0KA92_9BACT|nr:MAG: hypothetical protein COV91_05500 [Candidatus Taylorbacteria bacterium CG11_big_fil_rev_8_21_14_0_20_46_11]
MTKNRKTNNDDVILSTLENGKNITIKDYRRFIKENNKSAIAEMFFHRLYSRYLKSFTFKNPIYRKDYKNGFAIMANCCLCIEALQSFKNGWGKTPKGGGRIFDNFFNGATKLNGFSKKDFYKHVRCGILHQGETTGGWRIKRAGSLLENKVINATKFLDELHKELNLYAEELRNSEWKSKTWDKYRVKMKKIIKSC